MSSRDNIKIYEGQSGRAWATSYEFRPNEEHLIRKYFKVGDSVLDLSCGAGRTTLLMHEMGLKVKGIDLSETLIGIASRRFPYIPFEVGDFTAINVPDQSVDHVLISFNSIDCAADLAARHAALRECRRVLKPKGTLIFSSHNLRSYFLSPYYVLHGKGWVHLKRMPISLRPYAFIFEYNHILFHGSPAFVSQEVIDSGFVLLEKVGLRGKTSPRWLSISPEIHYVCQRND